MYKILIYIYFPGYLYCFYIYFSVVIHFAFFVLLWMVVFFPNNMKFRNVTKLK